MWLIGGTLNDLLRTSLFESLQELLTKVTQTILDAESVRLMAPADIEGMLALSQLEASFLDNGISYRRRVLAPRKHIPRDEISVISESEGLTIHIDPFHESVESFTISKKLIHICPTLVEVSFGTSSKVHHGAVDCVAICGTLASMIAPEGARVRRQRPMVLAGTWLRQSMEANYDPVMSMLRDHLDEEGSIDIRTIVDEYRDHHLPLGNIFYIL